LVDEVAEMASAIGIRPPEIVVVPGHTSPLIWGLGRARLIWPEGLLDHLPKSSRRSVLLHEFAHLRRRDHWVGWLQFLGGCLYWWNPLFWYVARQVRENAEFACDAWVVATLPGGRRAFADALIEVAQMMSQLKAPAPALTLGAGRRRVLERRLVMIMCAGTPCKVSLGGFVAVGLLTLAAFPGWSQQPTPPQPVPALPGAVPPPAVPLTAAPAIAEFQPPVAPGQPSPYAVAPSVVPGGDPGDPDARLKAIEQQLQALLKEVRSMRGGANKPEYPANALFYPQRAVTPPPMIHSAPAEVNMVPPGRPVAGTATKGGEVTLLRATYELSHAKAEALAALLKDSKGPAVELKSEDDKVTVTTTPEAQNIIAQLIAMMQGKASTPHTYYQIQAVPVTAYPAAPAKR
jgi:hypothetical protein